MATDGPGSAAFSLRPLNIADLLDQMVRIYRARFGDLIAIAAVILVPLAVVRTIAAAFWEPGPELSELPVGFNMLMATGGDDTGITVLLTWLLVPLMQAATAMAVSVYYLGGQTTLGDAYRFGLRRWLRLIGVALLVGLAAGAAALVVVIPISLLMGVIMAGIGTGTGTGPAATVAIVLVSVAVMFAALIGVVAIMVKLALAAYAVVLEDRRAVASLRRSWDLTRGHFWRVFGTLIVVGLFVLIINLIVILPVYLLLSAAQAGVPETVSNIVMAAVASLVELVTVPLQIIATVLLYYDLRIRKEGFDLAMMAEAIGQPERAPRLPSGEARAPLFGAPPAGAPPTPPPPGEPAFGPAPPPPPGPPPTGQPDLPAPPPTTAPPETARPTAPPGPPPIPDIPEEPEDDPGDRPGLPGT
jgi:hypothetical protein